MPTKQFVDPVFGSIKIAEQQVVNFMDAAESQLSRLGRCANLGLISEIFPSARHSRLEHHLGTCHLALSLRRTNKETKRTLALLSLIRGFGHLPYGFVAEEAVLIASHIAPTVRNELADMMAPVLRMLENKHQKPDPAGFSKVFDEYQTKQLYKWMSAYHVWMLGNAIKADREGLVDALVNRKNPLYQVVQMLDEFDYVQRDLYMSGVARLQVNSELIENGLFQALVEPAGGSPVPSVDPEEKLFQATRDYLMERVYCDPEVMWLEALVKKELAQLLVSGELTLKALINMDDDDLRKALLSLEANGKARSISTLKRMRSRLVAGIEASVRLLTAGRQFFSFESVVTGKTGDSLLRYPTETGYVLTAKWKNSKSVVLSVLAARTETIGITELMSAIGKLTSELRHFEEKDSKFLPFRPEPPARVNFDEVLSYIFNDTVRIKPLPCATTVSQALGSLSDKIIDAACKDGPSMALTVFHSAQKYPSWLASTMVEQSYQQILARLAPDLIKTLTARQASMQPSDAGSIHEVVVFLHTLASLEPDCLWAWVWPNVMIGDESEAADAKSHKNQVDIVALKVFADRVELHLVECTGENSTAKAMDDAEKLELLKERIVRHLRQPTLHVLTRVLGRSVAKDTFLNLDSVYDKYR